jgi:hypothetical protein
MNKFSSIPDLRDISLKLSHDKKLAKDVDQHYQNIKKQCDGLKLVKFPENPSDNNGEYLGPIRTQSLTLDRLLDIARNTEGGIAVFRSTNHERIFIYTQEEKAKEEEV